MTRIYWYARSLGQLVAEQMAGLVKVGLMCNCGVYLKVDDAGVAPGRAGTYRSKLK